MQSSRVVDLPRRIYRQLYSLNMRRNGTMRDRLAQCRAGEIDGWAHWSGDPVDGWALVFVHPQYGKTCYLYVRKSRRKSGLGAGLLELAKKSHGQLTVWAWCWRAERFYWRYHEGLNIYVTGEDNGPTPA